MLSDLNVCSIYPKDGRFTLAAPLFRGTIIGLTGEGALAVLTGGPGGGICVAGMRLGKRPVSMGFVACTRLVRNKRLHFALSSGPGVRENISSRTSPCSCAGSRIISVPCISGSLGLFVSGMAITLTAAAGSTRVECALSNDRPARRSTLCRRPFRLSGAALVGTGKFGRNLHSDEALSVSTAGTRLGTTLSMGPARGNASCGCFRNACRGITSMRGSPLLRSNIVPRPSVGNTGRRSRFNCVFSKLVGIPRSKICAFRAHSSSNDILCVRSRRMIGGSTSRTTVPTAKVITLGGNFRPCGLCCFRSCRNRCLD